MEFAQVLSKLMEENGVSMYRLAKELECSQSSVKNWISGNSMPYNKTIKQLCEFFCVSKDVLLGKEEQKDDRYAKLQALRDKQRILLAVSENASDEDIDKTISFLEYLTRRPNDAD